MHTERTAGASVAADTTTRIGRRGLIAGAGAVGTAAALTAFTVPAIAARPTLRLGSRGAAVKDLQNRLRQVTSWRGAADGVFGKATRSGVIAFQKSKRLAADGVVGAKTWAALDAATTEPAPGGSRPTLRKGSSGAAVKQLQARLNATTYWVGGADGKFGGTTLQAVYALQKAAGLKPDGVVGAKTWAALDRGVKPRPTVTSGTAFEVDLGKQLLYCISGGVLKFTLNTSTGSGERYYSGGRWKRATTPRGKFRIYRRHTKGWQTGPLGNMYRPAYYDRGWAIHGSNSIPPYPASHGCSRVSTAAADMLWARSWFVNGRVVVVR
ncbi:peptidoglycan-binding protein [Helcobacillus sp. ACRRO]|uniref:L,D-transpeptidase family protein n=1 Tax=Helcobacillus sp. ACRRO TaxID=2918202 RepID=UPI001EF62D5B|nr:peptidoglycan-binding protein [Helcobacillus sp. ACRRO]MCG7428068.1 peptidoglycan-binding protein [Helcobacillus sp. ACRRO]